MSIHLSIKAAQRLARKKSLSANPSDIRNKAVAAISKPLIDATHKIMLAKASIEDELLASQGMRGGALDAETFNKALDALDDLNSAVNRALDCHSSLKAIMRSSATPVEYKQDEFELPVRRMGAKRHMRYRI